MTTSSAPSSAFKGYPLLDFVDSRGFTLDGIFRNASLRAELERHLRGFSSGDDEVQGCGMPPPRTKPEKPVKPSKWDLSVDGKTARSFEERLKSFLDGLYLGCFKSSVVQPEPRRPPHRYIYDIGFNTDKLTGFLVANPFDTLVTFGPRGRHAGFGAFDPAVLDLPRAPAIRVTPSAPQRPPGNKKGDFVNPAFVTTFETAEVGGRGDPPKASIICDLNIRVVVNHLQQLQELSFYGDTMKVHLSKGLVQPVQRSERDEWVKTGKRLALDMGKRMITLRRGRLPTWGGPLDLGGALVTITASALVARLHRVNIGGTVEKPLMLFDQVEILT